MSWFPGSQDGYNQGAPQGYGGYPGSQYPPQGGYGGPPPQQYGQWQGQQSVAYGAPPPQQQHGGYNGQWQNQPGGYGGPPQQQYGGTYGQQPQVAGYARPGPSSPPQGMQVFGNGAPREYAFQYSNCTGRRKALLIGINYFGQKGELRGCINDVHNMTTYLTGNFGYRSEDIVTLTGKYLAYT
ncbi:hypothetical protein K3495_g10094 [Podosphaera aphanis]|nr:hypothetical protein K3495_g10094 [Podosphaera aphanis]